MIPKDLLEWLEKRFSMPIPSPSESPNFVWFAAGQAALVKDLRIHYDKQQAPQYINGG